ncbi:response regulator [bacterium]|nr:response regulator [bacterium]
MSDLVRVMMIDDSESDVFLIHEILHKSLDAYFEVESYPTLGEGLKHLAETRFDIVLLDLTLPDSRGIDTFHRMSQAYPLLPVIVMSGLDDHDTVQTIIESGAQDYLVKGEISSTLLKRSILNALRRKRAEEELKLFRKAIDAMQLGVVITDEKGEILYSNPSAADILGFSTTEMIGQPLGQLTPDAHRFREDKYFDTSFRRKDGTSVQVKILADPISFSSDPSRLVFAILELK